MPVYEYECKNCGRHFEYQQRMSDDDKTLCEACGKETLERLISRTAFALKGGGWYKDLYSSTKPDSGSSSGSSSSSSSSESTTSTSTSTESSSSTPSTTPSTSGGSTSGGSTT